MYYNYSCWFAHVNFDIELTSIESGAKHDFISFFICLISFWIFNIDSCQSKYSWLWVLNTHHVIKQNNRGSGGVCVWCVCVCEGGGCVCVVCGGMGGWVGGWRVGGVYLTLSLRCTTSYSKYVQQCIKINESYEYHLQNSIQAIDHKHHRRVIHYNDVKICAMASQITSRLNVYSSVYSSRSKKTSQLSVTGLCEGN